MPKVLRPIGHEDRLSIVDHLDELRSRLFVCGIALVIAFAVCFWQNQFLLKALNRALPATPATTPEPHLGPDGRQRQRGEGTQVTGLQPAAALRLGSAVGA